MIQYSFIKEQMNMTPWKGVDLDETLAEYHGYKGPKHIGKPIPKMVRRILGWKKKGIIVKIMTARVNPSNPDSETSRKAIQQWLQKYIQPLLKQIKDDPSFYEIPITHEKDCAMDELWDDKAVQVEPNTGECVDDESDSIDEDKLLDQLVSQLPK